MTKSPEHYEPSPEDIQRAEEMMTDEEKAMSEQRETEFEQNEKEKLLQYAQENCAEYMTVDRKNWIIKDPEFFELRSTIEQNNETFQNETLPNAPNELLERAIAVINGKEDKQIVAVLERMNLDYRKLLASKGDDESKAIKLLSAVLKGQSYDEAVEQNKDKEIIFEGFDDDPDMAGAKEFIHRNFSEETLKKCLISKIEYFPNDVAVDFGSAGYKLPVEVYKQWEQAMPEVKKRKFRASSLVTWNTDNTFSKKFMPTPIRVYSFYGEQPEKLDYLRDAPENQKMRLYKLGSVAHEIAHHVYGYMIGLDQRRDWKALVDKTGAITGYAKSYDKNSFKYDEFFAEAVRLKTTAPAYLKEHFPEIDKFLADNSPE